jgi:uncharacterized protein with NAD-binding domain and iron-sulfur cluster
MSKVLIAGAGLAGLTAAMEPEPGGSVPDMRIFAADPGAPAGSSCP